MKYHNIKDFDSIVKIEKSELQKMVETYVIYLKKNISPNSVPSQVNTVKTFLEANDIDLNWRKIKRLYPAPVKRSGSSAYSTEDVKKMLDASPQLRNKSIIHFLASSGIRIGALPELKLKHIRDMPLGCKMITIYENSTEEYHTFLTPEASSVLDAYLDQRRKNNEILSEESPLFRERYQLGLTAAKSISKGSIQGIIIRALKNSNVRGQKKNNRYSEQLAHGFRKRFNTILKLNNQVNDNAIEKMMGHSNGLDGTYFQGTIEQLFEEFSKGISDLTISDSERLKIRNEKLEMENKESVNQSTKIKDLEQKLETVIHKLELIQNTSETKTDITKN
jgi:integrase/recombinase XerD